VQNFDASYEWDGATDRNIPWQEWFHRLYSSMDTGQGQAVLRELDAKRLRIVAEAESQPWDLTRDQLFQGRVALAAILGVYVMAELSRFLTRHPQFAMFEIDGRTPRDDVVSAVVNESLGSGFDTPFRRFFLLARRLQRVGAIAARQAMGAAAGHPHLAPVLEEYEVYRNTMRTLGPRRERNALQDASSAMASGLTVEILNGMRFYESLPRLFATYGGVALTNEAIHQSMANSVLSRERARQGAPLVRVMNRLLAGCNPNCYSKDPALVAAKSPHSALMSEFPDLAAFQAQHGAFIGIDIRRLALFEWQQNGHPRLEAWLSFPIQSAVDPKSGVVVGAMHSRAVHGCPMTVHQGIGALDVILANVANHPSILGNAVDVAQRQRQEIRGLPSRRVAPFHERPPLNGPMQTIDRTLPGSLMM
jgi:hypothetical protein